ncbi:MAG: pantoate--beta-alanine ligase [Gemmatales bacterium]|nr:pantoate--beta-alanine ligase [Gemmatales bacterium]MDW7994750.1 pantoate--beta-alanine ligase [Gemmatales bacterium]
MQIVATITETRCIIQKARNEGRRIGFVPTMGALHEGHASLIRAARRETDFVVVSIFVNPTQFGPNEDYQRYPRTPEADWALCRREGVDLVFSPSVEEMYPPGFCTWVEVTRLQDVLCGRSRPGHFRGVATVVLKLLNIVQPDIAYFGQKDAQQARIIRQLVHDLNVPIEIRVCPIVREADGLALSSRNAYLSPQERQHATVLYRALQLAQELVNQGECDTSRIRQRMVDLITATPGATLDYAEIVDPETLQPVAQITGPALAALAVRLGSARLIDNQLLIPQTSSVPGVRNEAQSDI